MRFGLLTSLLAFFLALGLAGTAFAGPGLGDTDSDGWDDVFDNCQTVPNASQLDVDGDGCGNICDGDFNNDGVVDGPDFLDFRGGFLTGASGVTDHDGNGVTEGADFILFRGQFLVGVPGPSLNAFRDQTACP
jgi:hypothetical protein